MFTSETKLRGVPKSVKKSSFFTLSATPPPKKITGGPQVGLFWQNFTENVSLFVIFWHIFSEKWSFLSDLGTPRKRFSFVKNSSKMKVDFEKNDEICLPPVRMVTSKISMYDFQNFWTSIWKKRWRLPNQSIHDQIKSFEVWPIYYQVLVTLELEHICIDCGQQMWDLALKSVSFSSWEMRFWIRIWKSI